MADNPRNTSSSSDLAPELFSGRHLGLTESDRAEMLAVVGYESLDALVAATVPATIRWNETLDLPPAVPEHEVLVRLRALFTDDVRRLSMIGQGYYGTVTPPVIRRNVLENPAWYTAYTPYQPEISQGRLEALLNFQTMVAELTALPLANASLLDEATAAAEALTLAMRQSKSESKVFLVDSDTHPQTIAVLQTRAEPIGVELVVAPLDELIALDGFGVLVSWPSSTGRLDRGRNVRAITERARAMGAVSIACTDLLACTLVVPPGEMGFDVAVGSAQRFGVPFGFGGPHAAFMAVRETMSRSLPGRLVGVSTDTEGRPALRLALQTREQHIRREKATSNICTAQVLLANIAGLYGAWHGPEGLQRIARRANALARAAATVLTAGGAAVDTVHVFDTVCATMDDADAAVAAARAAGVNIRRVDARRISFSVDETTSISDVATVVSALGIAGADAALEAAISALAPLDAEIVRETPFMEQSIFNRLHSEHEMLRYLRRLADKDLALDRTMIPLGSCTMKLNSTTEMEPVTWPELANVHPFVPDDESVGYRRLVAELESMLCEVTGYDAVSLQPNAGSQGEFAGLLAIRAYHRSRGDVSRDICLIPSSAHGTNAASAVMAGMQVVVVDCDEAGNVDLADLTAKAGAAGTRLAALMVTYPSTHGVFEEAISDICALVHDLGGQVYVDGANLNALVGLAKPGKFGADVSHLNLHKTFCIPHGGGGPGVGPVAVRAHLAPYLPGHPMDPDAAVGPVSAAPYGSAGILAIPWTYITMMGAEGLRSATADAILSANYVSRRLSAHFPTLYAGANGTVAHECILDVREITRRSGVTVDDVAKRLMDHMFHAPTMSFPVAGTLMVEPTESESRAELDRFCESMISIAGEIADVIDGKWSVEESPLRHAPHVVEDVVGDWDRRYTRSVGVHPLPHLRSKTYYPPVSRIDAAFGDRNLVCTCTPIEAYADSLVTVGGA